MKGILLYITLLICSFSGIWAQVSNVDFDNDEKFQKALSLYIGKHYEASQKIFSEIKTDKLNFSKKSYIDYYDAQCAIRLKQKGADKKMLHFVEAHPSHPKRNNAFFDVGNYFFSVGNYARARKWYDKVDEIRLTKLEGELFNFNKAYSYYKAERYKDANKYFNLAKDSKQYGEQAKYYLGYIAYQNDDYETADKFFEEVSDSLSTDKGLAYYKADRNFKRGKFQKAIENAQRQLPKADLIEKSELNKIVGESYFNQKKYTKAIPYLEKYKGDRGKWSNTDHYFLGYSYYKEKDYEKALTQFNKIIGGKDKVAQNAYYHLGDTYLKLNKKQQAFTAFKNASEMNFDAEIKEDAFYNYAKLSYEQGNSFEPVSVVLKGFLKEYPNSIHNVEVSELLVDSYLSSKNYKQALAQLESDPIQLAKHQQVYQKVLLFRGQEFFTQGNFEDAIYLLGKAAEIKGNDEVSKRAYFWLGESNYRLGKYDIAAKSFEAITLPYEWEQLKLTQYHLGYSYFKLKDYDNAIEHFNLFISSDTTTSYVNDATVRLADSYFVNADYWKAIETYNTVEKEFPKGAPYALYQKSLCYGFLRQNDKKIAGLESFTTKHIASTYLDDVYYALANVYIAEGNTTKGIANYKKIQTNLPKSPLVSKSMLKEGLLYYNQDEYDAAIERFKTVVDKFPKTAEALQAVQSARLVYIDKGDPETYATWVNTLDFVEITNEELDITTYAAAEKPYLDNKLREAIIGFEKYLKQFPQGLHVLQSHFYLAQSYYKTQQAKSSSVHYAFVADAPKSEFSETSIATLAEIYLKENNYKAAIPYLKRLETEADFDENKRFAETNLMKSYYEKEDFTNTLAYVSKVLSRKEINEEIKRDATIYKARASLATGKKEIAKQAYQAVAKDAKGKIGAEAVYHLALFEFQDNNFENSNVLVQRLAKDFSGYRVYGAKSLIIMAQNFYGLNDAYQATYILESVTKNFKDFPAVVQEASILLEEIKEKEAKVNSSIKAP